MSMIKEVPPHNKPREKAMRYGVRSLSGSELIALILRSGPKGSSVLETADPDTAQRSERIECS